MNIFLTGATGFLGYHTVQELLDRGHQLTALVRPSGDNSHLKNKPIHWVQGSLPKQIDLSSILAGVDAVIHLAGSTRALSKNDFYSVNTLGTQKLVEALIKANPKPKTFLYVSTIAVHNPQTGPDFCIPTGACRPLSYYGESKLGGELALAPLKGKVRSIILRPPVLYGPRDQEFLPLFKAIRKGIAPLFGKGDKELSACYVSDVARAIAGLIETPPDQDEIFCLDDGEVHTWKSLANDIALSLNKNVRALNIPPWVFYFAAGLTQTWAKFIKRPAMLTTNKIKEMEQDRWVCGYKKLQEHLGWEPEIPLKDGLKRTLEYYQRDGRI